MTSSTRHVDWRSTAIVVLASAVLFGAYRGASVFAQQGTAIQVTIDSPAGGSLIPNGQTLEISGWAVDWLAGLGTGVDRVEVYVDGPRGLSPLWLEATYGTYRPDVTQAFGRPDWIGSGFRVQWMPQGLAPGQHTLYVYARSLSGEWSSDTVTMAIVPPAAGLSDYVPPQPGLSEYLPPQPVVAPVVPSVPAPMPGPFQPPVNYPCNPSLPYGVFDSYGLPPCPR